uniref:Uncharacterized protein n=1 Tax=uncultured organism MedDCM-OCT-S09-C568 TaxID=743651 RepID=D6PJE7_9ZZZZ|nr:hypothetical protein [uncultured organism MedDCM-OCT-S09-C568]ADD95851.1 hypothetical protein [uncultured organism MedDCM-OCT-S09-C568]
MRVLIVERRKFELEELLTSIKEEEEEYKFYLEKLRRAQRDDWLHTSSSLLLLYHWVRILDIREILQLPCLIYKELFGRQRNLEEEEVSEPGSSFYSSDRDAESESGSSAATADKAQSVTTKAAATHGTESVSGNYKDTANKDASNKEAANKEAANKDAGNKDTVNKDIVNRDAGNKDTVNKDAAKRSLPSEKAASSQRATEQYGAGCRPTADVNLADIVFLDDDEGDYYDGDDRNGRTTAKPSVPEINSNNVSTKSPAVIRVIPPKTDPAQNTADLSSPAQSPPPQSPNTAASEDCNSYK